MKKKPRANQGPQRFHYTQVPRGRIQTADYNPREIDEASRKRLWKILDKHGLVEPLVWNKTTGNLVGGHQRLAWWDTKFPAGSSDHSVPVAQVELSLKCEQALNIALNNPEAQGGFDDSKLSALLRELGELAVDDTGFDSAGIEAILDEASAILKPLEVAAPPKMAWVLIGIPLGRFGEISPFVEKCAAIPDALVETTASDVGAPE